MTALLGLFLSSDDLAQAFNVPQANFHINLLAFGLLYTPISVLIGWGVNAFSRHNEYQADAFAANHGQTEPLISALKKLSVKSLSNLTPHPAFVSFYYSHPTLLQRIRAMRKQN
jgi:STE24 endopeptidase